MHNQKIGIGAIGLFSVVISVPFLFYMKKISSSLNRIEKRSRLSVVIPPTHQE